MPRVLIIAYHFPPSAAVGGLRPAKFAKYLPEFGWEPHVLTLPLGASRAEDLRRLQELATLPVHRAAPLPTPLDLYLGIKRLVARGSGAGPVQASRSPAPPPGAHRRTRLSVAREAAARCFSTAFEMPDKEVGWLPPAVVHGLRLIRREKIDVLLATSPPVSAAAAGLVLSALSGRPLVTDLRDPLILHAAKPPSQRTRLSDLLDRWLERRILYGSARIVTTTSRLRSTLLAQFPRLPQQAVQAIANGYDPEDFAPSEPERPGKFVLSYLGTFYYGRSPRELLLALGELVREGALDPRDLEVVFCGNVAVAEGVPVGDLIRQAGLAGCVTVRGQVSYREAIQQMLRSTALILLAPDQPLQIPGKAFEYLGARRHVLCLASPGATADLIRDSGAGCVVEPHDVPGIKRALGDLYGRWKAGGRVEPRTQTAMYERRALTGQLGLLLGSILPDAPQRITALPASSAPPASAPGPR